MCMEFETLENSNDETISENNQSNKTNANKKLKSDSAIFNFLLVFSLVFLLNIYIFNIILKPIKVVGESMQPTINSSVLSDNDEQHCDIVYYRPSENYNHGDIVIVANSNDKYFDANEEIYLIIKRIIACSGDTIKFIPKNDFPSSVPNSKMYYSIEVKDKNGKIILNQEDYIKDDMFFINDDSYYSAYLNTFDTFYHLYYSLKTGTSFEITIPENCYFIMGDNRNNSTDSRVFGYVDQVDIWGSVRLQVDYGENVYQAIFEKIKK